MTEAPAARELDITLERNSPVPLYHQLAQSIEHAINTGALSPGDRLENELSLTSRLGLSRPTARQAIQELVKKGMLVRKRGVGTQVVRSQFRRDERLSSFNEDLTKAGKVPGTRSGALIKTCEMPSTPRKPATRPSSRSGGYGLLTMCRWRS
jgi:GntR family transcriptional regulator